MWKTLCSTAWVAQPQEWTIMADEHNRKTFKKCKKKKKKDGRVSLLKPDESQNKEINPHGQAKHMVV